MTIYKTRILDWTYWHFVNIIYKIRMTIIFRHKIGVHWLCDKKSLNILVEHATLLDSLKLDFGIGVVCTINVINNLHHVINNTNMVPKRWMLRISFDIASNLSSKLCIWFSLMQVMCMVTCMWPRLCFYITNIISWCNFWWILTSTISCVYLTSIIGEGDCQKHP